ncbi:hypothetical protein [Nocardia sp. NPDC050435]|uniref:hypothetical protein n=1 Tax=Nocardia sp. NPDC050435 TaxID=3155040 RepID=UPI0033E584B3
MHDPELRRPSIAAIQEYLLKTLQNLSADRHAVQQRLDHSRYALTGDARYEWDWQRQVLGLTHLREIVTDSAAAIGVPAPAVDAAMMRGETGKRWQRNQPLPRTKTVERRQLIDRLLDQVHRYNNMAAVHRAYVERFGAPEGNSGMYHRGTLDALHQRIGAVAYALHLSPDEKTYLWGHSDYVVKTLTTHYLDGAESALLDRWDTTANGAIWHRESQLGQPLREAGITRTAIAASGQSPPTPDELINALGPSLSIRGSEANLEPAAGGSEISSAIEAADPGTEATELGTADPTDPSTDAGPTPPGLDP